MTETPEMLSQCWGSHPGRQGQCLHQRMEEKELAGLRGTEAYRSRGEQACAEAEWGGEEECRAGGRAEKVSGQAEVDLLGLRA